jgi:hypothetical protein
MYSRTCNCRIAGRHWRKPSLPLPVGRVDSESVALVLRRLACAADVRFGRAPIHFFQKVDIVTLRWALYVDRAKSISTPWSEIGGR